MSNFSIKNIQVQPIKTWLEAIELKKNDIFKFLTLDYYETFQSTIEELGKETLNVTVSQRLPYVNIHRHHYEGHHHMICGYIGDLWSELQNVLHFKTNFTVMEEITDVREALRNTSDNLLLIPIIVQSGDHSEFGSTMPVAITWYQLSAVNPKSGSSFFYMSIFTTPLMATYLVTMIVLTIFLWFLIKISSSKKTQVSEKKVNLQICDDATIADTSVMASFLTILGIFTNQGTQLKVSTVSLRLLMLSCTMLGFILIQAYSAILLSQLAIKQIPSQITLNDLPEAMPHRSLCLSESSMAYNTFLEENSTEILPKWKPILNRPPCIVGLFKYDMVSLDDYCDERNMVFESQHSTNYIRNEANLHGSNTVDCNFYTFSQRYKITYISLLTKKNFKYKSLLSLYFLKFHTSGIIKKYQETWLPISPIQRVKVKSNEPIKFAHMKDLLLLYALTIMISLIIFSIEILVHSKKFGISKAIQKNMMKFKLDFLKSKN